MSRYKNSKLSYYLQGYARLLCPRVWTQKQLSRLLAEGKVLAAKDKEVQRRVDYYCQLDKITPLPQEAPALGQHTYKNKKGASVYFFDTHEIVRYFNQSLHWLFQRGDVTTVFDYPTVVKSRPIATETTDNRNSIILKLNKIRHFFFVDDPIATEQKKPIALFRGAVHGKPKRQRFLEQYIDHPMCDIRDTAHNSDNPAAWRAESMSIREHLDYKYIVALEGNDVASCLKWVMSSNSVAVMPRPTYETWFMEGTLIPDYHYIVIKSDYSDFIERITFYENHPEKLKEIVRHAKEYVQQFRDRKREKLISLMVMDKYFRMTGQQD